MLVRFKRNWFGPSGIRYKTRDGLAEVPDDLRDQLPKDAEIMDDPKITELPSKGLAPVPGFGAIPEHEQKLADLGAAPTHVITAAAGEGQAPSKGDFLDDDGSAKADAKRREAKEREADDKVAAKHKAEEEAFLKQLADDDKAKAALATKALDDKKAAEKTSTTPPVKPKGTGL